MIFRKLSIILLCALFITNVYSQRSGWKRDFKDNFKFLSGVTVSLTSIKYNAIWNSSEEFGVIGSTEFPATPMYYKEARKGSVGTFYTKFGLDIPLLFFGDGFISGVNVGGAIGVARSLKNAEGLTAFPQFYVPYGLFLDKEVNRYINFGIYGERAHTFGPLRYENINVGLRCSIDDGQLIKLGTTIIPQDYYIYYTNGILEKGMSIRETFAITYMVSF